MRGLILSVVLLLASGRTLGAIDPSRQPLRALLEKPYLDLLELAPSLNYEGAEIERVRKQLSTERHEMDQRLRNEEKALAQQISAARKELDALNRRGVQDSPETASQRRLIHCRIYKLEKAAREKKTEREQAIRARFENFEAKLDLIEQWPARREGVLALRDSGAARQRKHGDPEDIGVRKLQNGQEKDIKLGEEAIRDLKAYGMMPRVLEDKVVTAYIEKLTERIAPHTDLRVPAKVQVLDSIEINAFALPGGYLYLNRGLLEKAGSESELVGVITHELAHAAARHGARLMHKATIASVIYSAAQVAAIIFTGGAAGIGTYYALQYGFYGLGMALNLTLLGVNREFEQEADQLGVQYAWHAGYDPRGFVSFFDRMASAQGHVQAASFFRTHPPFFDRMVSTFTEILLLPDRGAPVVDSTAFQHMKESLAKVKRPLDKRAPTLRPLPECDPDEPPASGKENAPQISRVEWSVFHATCDDYPAGYRRP